MTADALTDVAGVRVGHATCTGDGWLTGTTVVLASSRASSSVKIYSGFIRPPFVSCVRGLYGRMGAGASPGR